MIMSKTIYAYLVATNGEIIYAGQSVYMPDRITQHRKVLANLASVKREDLEFRCAVCDSVIEACLLEMSIIKSCKPRFNTAGLSRAYFPPSYVYGWRDVKDFFEPVDLQISLNRVPVFSPKNYGQYPHWLDVFSTQNSFQDTYKMLTSFVREIRELGRTTLKRRR